MKTVCITPTRGDRTKLLAFCKNQIANQTVRPDQHIIIDYPPKSNGFDLTERIKRGVEIAGEANIIIIEDDDYYPKDYIESITRAFDNGAGAVGRYETIYYHIKTKRWVRLKHHGRSSLFMTSFKSSLLKNFVWPDNKQVFLDIVLWKHLNRVTDRIYFTRSEPIGIKHGIGKTGGMGHKRSGNFPNYDNNYSLLKQSVSKEAFDFYTNL